MVKKNVCVFISGTSSNFKNLIKRSREYNFPIKIKFVVCNKEICSWPQLRKNQFDSIFSN